MLEEGKSLTNKVLPGNFEELHRRFSSKDGGMAWWQEQEQRLRQLKVPEDLATLHDAYRHALMHYPVPSKLAEELGEEIGNRKRRESSHGLLAKADTSHVKRTLKRV